MSLLAMPYWSVSILWLLLKSSFHLCQGSLHLLGLITKQVLEAFYMLENNLRGSFHLRANSVWSFSSED